MHSRWLGRVLDKGCLTVFGYAADEDPSALLDAGAIVFDSMQKLPWLFGFD